LQAHAEFEQALVVSGLPRDAATCSAMNVVKAVCARKAGNRCVVDVQPLRREFMVSLLRVVSVRNREKTT
jgi:hypothetical protein